MPSNPFAALSVYDATSGTFSVAAFLLCLLCSLALGLLIAAVYRRKNTYTKSFVVTLSLLPAIVQMVIMLVNGNVGAGVAVMGAFSLVRFRSIPGTAREICAIFLAMAVGLATGMGYLLLAALFAVLLCAVFWVLLETPFGEQKTEEKLLRITIPEDLDYTHVFDDLFSEYAAKHELYQVRTTNMGSLYKLHYHVTLKDSEREKQFIDALRCRNGNLEIFLGRVESGQEML